MSTTSETRKPLADYAPRTYRHLNPRPLKRLARELIDLVGPEESPRDAKLLVAEYVAEQVKLSDESIVGIQREELVAGILSKSGLTDNGVEQPITETGVRLSLVTLDGLKYAIDYSAKQSIMPLHEWIDR
jgi:hypothetical protein